MVVIQLATRKPCKWKEIPSDTVQGRICAVCNGHIQYNNVELCPFEGMYGINPRLQHMISADERYFCIQQLRKINEAKVA